MVDVMRSPGQASRSAGPKIGTEPAKGEGRQANQGLYEIQQPVFQCIMSNESSIEPGSPATPSLSSPPVRETFNFPTQLIEQWTSIPESERINAPLTRQDLDHLIFGLLRSHDSQTALDTTLVHWSHNRIDEANSALEEARRLNVDAQNHTRQFFTAMMISALQERNRAK